MRAKQPGVTRRPREATEKTWLLQPVQEEPFENAGAARGTDLFLTHAVFEEQQTTLIESREYGLFARQIDLSSQIAVCPGAVVVLCHCDDLRLHTLHNQLDLETSGSEKLQQGCGERAILHLDSVSRNSARCRCVGDQQASALGPKFSRPRSDLR